jgi:hypothetical protein
MKGLLPVFFRGGINLWVTRNTRHQPSCSVAGQWKSQETPKHDAVGRRMSIEADTIAWAVHTNIRVPDSESVVLGQPEFNKKQCTDVLTGWLHAYNYSNKVGEWLIIKLNTLSNNYVNKWLLDYIKMLQKQSLLLHRVFLRLTKY